MEASHSTQGPLVVNNGSARPERQSRLQQRAHLALAVLLLIRVGGAVGAAILVAPVLLAPLLLAVLAALLVPAAPSARVPAP